ncbi:MAG: proton-conducting transporter membrane subunit, partial [Candidatus Thorarchaeota archaeon]
KAGVYLMSRFYFVFAPTELEAFFITFALIAVITAFIAAASALVSIDIKRILAYSTVSQLAYMFMGLAIGYLAYRDELEMSMEGFMGAQFHLMSHAIFKALLFLSAGAIIHSLNGERNIKKMGGLREDFPVIHIATLIGVCALAGIPLFNGFFSKETILGSAIEFGTSEADLAPWGLLIFAIGAITALLTAIYAFRFFFLVFYGEKPEGLEVHPAGLVMRGVTGILALLVIVSGLIGPIFLNELFENMFAESGHDMPLGHFPESTEAIIGALVTIAIVILGVAVSYYIYYLGPRTVMPVVRQYRLLNACHIIAREGFYLDAFYQGLQDLFMWADWKLRKLQTGDLNYNMSLLGLVGLTLAIIVLIL